VLRVPAAAAVLPPVLPQQWVLLRAGPANDAAMPEYALNAAPHAPLPRSLETAVLAPQSRAEPASVLAAALRQKLDE
jgi:hypothetical protein